MMYLFVENYYNPPNPNNHACLTQVLKDVLYSWPNENNVSR